MIPNPSITLNLYLYLSPSSLTTSCHGVLPWGHRSLVCSVYQMLLLRLWPWRWPWRRTPPHIAAKSLSLYIWSLCLYQSLLHFWPWVTFHLNMSASSTSPPFWFVYSDSRVQPADTRGAGTLVGRQRRFQRKRASMETKTVAVLVTGGEVIYAIPNSSGLLRLATTSDKRPLLW